jgi:flagella basal body P-ring formation protein FlgA
MPIQTSAIQRPILVAKGSLVTIILRTPKMTLTAQGKALDNGADGDTVRITNSQSKKVIEAEVTGTARVAVVPSGSMAMN